MPSWGLRWQVTGTTAAAWIPRDVHQATRSPRAPGSHCRQLRRLRAARAALLGVRATMPRRTHGPRGLQAAGRLGLNLCPQCRRCPRSPAAAARSPRGARILRAAPAWGPRGRSHSRRVQAGAARSCAAARSPGGPFSAAGPSPGPRAGVLTPRGVGAAKSKFILRPRGVARGGHAAAAGRRTLRGRCINLGDYPDIGNNTVYVTRRSPNSPAALREIGHIQYSLKF